MKAQKIMDSYKYSVELLSPLLICSGTELTAHEYLISNDVFYRLNLDSFIASLSSEKRIELEKALDSNDIIRLRKYIKENIRHLEHSFYSSPVTKDFLAEYFGKEDRPYNQLLIMECIRDSVKFQPYLPGSSLKGSLRTAVLDSIREAQGIVSWRFPERELEESLLEFQEKNKWGEWKKIMGKDPFRLISITDGHMVSGTSLIAEVFNSGFDRSGIFRFHGMQMFAEVLSGGEEGREAARFEGQMRFQTALSQSQIKRENRNYFNTIIPIDLIIKNCNTFYKAEMEREHSKFYEKAGGNIAAYSESLLAEAQRINSQNSCLVRIGRYCGVESHTLNKIRNPKTKTGKWGNTRNLCDKRYPMGWAKLTLHGE